MNILLTTKCLSKCKFCFVPKQLKTKQNEMAFVDFKKCLNHINFIYKNKQPVIGLLGGEPTLAKDFPLIIGYAKTYSGGVRLYSNLITDTKNIEYILGAKNMVLVWNIGAYLQATNKNKKLILKNLSLIKKDFKQNIIASITLYKNFQIKDFYNAIKILKKYNIKNVRVASDATQHKFFVSYGQQVYEFIKYLKKLNFNIATPYCGHFVKCMFNKEQEQYLKNNVENFNYNDCSKNYPLDILSTGKVVPCMGFSNQKSSIDFLKYKSLKNLQSAINKNFNLCKVLSICAKCNLQKKCGKLCIVQNENKK